MKNAGRVTTPVAPLNVEDELGNASTLPDDPALLREIIAKLVQQLTDAQVKSDRLRRELDQLKRGIWGRKSEKSDAAQLLIFAEALEALKAKTDAAAKPRASDDGKPSSDEKKRRKGGKKRGGGRGLIPPDLPRDNVRHELDDAARACPGCGDPREAIGEEASEQIEIVPVRIIVKRHVRVKYMCRSCRGQFVTADKPRSALEKCAAGPSVLSHLIVSKMDDHLPAYRQSEIFKRHGIHLPRSTISRWLIGAADALAILYTLMVTLARQSKVIHADETTHPVQDKGRGQVHRGRSWTYLGDARSPFTTYEYTRTKHGANPQAWLRGFNGHLQADAASVFNAIYDEASFGSRVDEVACWAHTRRKFEGSKLSAPAESITAMAFIAKLSRVEKQAAGMSPRRKAAVRRKHALPILTRFKEWLDDAAACALPNSELGKAIAYTRGNWDALNRYARNGRLSMDNNAAERALRQVAIGRKNWIFSGHDEGAQANAVLLTLVESAKRVGVNPEEWLTDVLAQIADAKLSELEDLLPHRWKVLRTSPTARHAIIMSRAGALAERLDAFKRSRRRELGTA